MKLSKVAEVLEGVVLTSQLTWQDIEIEKVCAADLMSDVLAFAQDKTLLLTGLVHPQVIRTSEILDIKAIIFVQDKIPPVEVIDLANQHEVPLFTTKLSMYKACGILYGQVLGVEEESP